MSDPRCDILCVGPHPDDMEIALGGTLALLAARGRTVWAADLTRGELASNAAPDERWAEALAAARVLGLAGRVQLSLPDGLVDAHAADQVAAVVGLLRRCRPRWILVAPEPRRHPDHLATPDLVQRAAFLSRLAAYQPAAPEARWWPGVPDGPADQPWICERIGVTALAHQDPSAIFDVSAHWQTKQQALACYGSQFRRDADRRPTHINDPDFLPSIADRARAWGRRAGVEHGEAIVTTVVPVLDDLPPEAWA